jgi:vacuolar-type H+-ATPase subunit E/Vma4
LSSEALKQEIRRTAGEKAEKVLADAKTNADKVLAEAESQARAITEDRIRDSEKLMSQLERSEAAKARMECARNLLSAQSRYVEEAFRQAETIVYGLPSSNPELYKSVLSRFIAEACAELSGFRLLVVARDSDRGLVEDVIRRLKAETESGGRALDCSVSGESLDARGGVILHTEDMRVYYVNTFESRFLKTKEELRAKVADTLVRQV